jgi:hypothetical protein
MNFDRRVTMKLQFASRHFFPEIGLRIADTEAARLRQNSPFISLLSTSEEKNFSNVSFHRNASTNKERPHRRPKNVGQSQNPIKPKLRN